ncbi:M57 family metalloprotease [uncultured Aquimarina sp.]|uniref:M57 family metalloprotease n=1 Tax=uncultured Aquimarina sp. TaxID=575652 RepID=UPI00260DBBD9|nr:M57 family metalloprotease [uncultured Aquimarina sp.]
MKKIKFTSVLIALCAITFFSCEKQENPEPLSENSIEQPTVPEDILQKLEQAGFYTNEGVYKYKNGYIVEYDIFLTEKEIFEYDKNSETTINSKQYRTTNLVSGTKTIRVYIDPALGSFAINSLNKAISRYNALNLRLTFKRTTNSGSNEIRIIPVNIPGGFLASAGFPSGGNAFKTIKLNTYYYNNTTSRADTPSVLAHEIGHAIGFRHTDYANRSFSCGTGGNEGSAGVGAIHIPGTPTVPVANSWMLACSNGKDRPFIASDRTALVNLYKKITPTTQPVSFYRFFRGGAKGNHYYSTSRSTPSGYAYEGVQCKVFSQQTSGTIPLYRFYNSSAVNHLYKTNRNAVGGYRYEGVAGYIYPSGGSGRIPLYRFYNSTAVDHFYTTNRNEGNSAVGYSYEGVTGYVLR